MVQQKEIINVGVYGGKSIFGGRETKLEASVISCDKHNECSYFANNQCLRVRSFGGSGCKFGETETVMGFTSKARKYHEFRSKWNNHEKNGLLSHPSNKLAVIEDFVVFPYSHIALIQKENGEIKLDDPWKKSNGKVFIERELFTLPLIHAICSFKPQAMMGGEITAYQKEVIPLFLTHMEEVMPELYEEFTQAYPEFSEKIDHVGRKAYLKTLNPSPIFDKHKNYPNLDSEWYWDGEFLTYKGGHISKISVIKDYEIENIAIRPTDKSVVTIADNNQVNKGTVFVD